MNMDNLNTAATIVAGIWAIVQLVPQFRKWRTETRNAIIIDALEAGIQKAYDLVTRPQRMAGVVKLPDHIREEAMNVAIDTALSVGSAHKVDLDKEMTREELRARLTDLLNDRKSFGIIGSSKSAVGGVE